ncbi:MAG: DUF3800 domain-containing protein [Candidatus Sumerlaeota bacterium]|nr:DUF3800 domain-containing protein [Candidatus Sumerlaeota bacterium]
MESVEPFPAQSLASKYYFVDESGDGVLFNKKGEIVAGSGGIPNHFILGLLDVTDPQRLDKDLAELRCAIMADPYFRGVPSLNAAQKKTAIAFHAKDDLPEIRKMVFTALLGQDIRFSAVIKNMQAAYHYVRGRNAADPAYRYHPDELYDHMARRLFSQRLHKESFYEVCFSRRGQSNRTKALAETLEHTRDRFCKAHGVSADSLVRVHCSYNHEQGGLQAVDYFLWALQRLYERGEDRFIQLLWSKVSFVHDIDDVSGKKYGVYYNEKRPLTAGALATRRLRI